MSKILYTFKRYRMVRFIKGNSLGPHNGYPFSTYDEDHDIKSNGNLAQLYGGAWWFENGRTSHLNGKYYCCGNTSSDGITWRQWKRDGNASDYSLKKSEMKIRRV